MNSVNMLYSDIFFESTHCHLEEFKIVMQKLEETNSINEKKEILTNIVTTYKLSLDENNENVEARNIILHFFTKFAGKKNFKKCVQDLVDQLGITVFMIQSSTLEISQQIQQKHCNIKQCLDLLNFIIQMQGTLDDNEKIIPFLFPVYSFIFGGFVYHLLNNNFQDLISIYEDLLALVNGVLKQIIFVFAKENEYIDVISKKYSAKLTILAYKVITSDNVGFELKTKSGLIFVHCLMIIPKVNCNCLTFPDCPPLEILVNSFGNSSLVVLGNDIQFFQNTESLVILYISLLNILPFEKMADVTINNMKLINLLYEGLIEFAKRKTNIPHVIVEISRSLSIVSKHLSLIPTESIENVFVTGLSYIISHIEHFVDSVKVYVKMFLKELVLTAAKHKELGNTKLVHHLLETIKKTEMNSMFRLYSYEYIAMNLENSFLLEHFPNLPQSLLDLISQSADEEVTKIYISILSICFNKEKNFEIWVETWVVPATKLLHTLNRQIPMFERILLKSIELHLPVLRILYDNDSISSTQECGVILKCLRQIRNNGMDLRLENKKYTTLYWRGLIAKNILEKCMIHQEDDIRISALAVIVECQKSTELFLDWEFSYLSNFLHYNITSFVPSFRNQIQSFYKKAIIRFNSSFTVVERNIDILNKKLLNQKENEELTVMLQKYQSIQNIYKSFIKKITQQLVSYLSYDSNYPRRVVSLHLLVILQTVMSPTEWLDCWNDDDVKNCHNILFDGYESNKKMAVSLLKYIRPTALGFTSIQFTTKYMQRCMEVALDRKSSRTVSAPYLLEVCTLSPHFQDMFQQADKNFSPQDVNNSNLKMLILLTHKLLAELNTANIPDDPNAYYGLISSITYFLQIKNTSKLNEDYSRLFDDLTTICLNLKDKLLPVVCDASPEGYIPDFDESIPETDESAKAQMIVVNAWRSIKEICNLLAEILKQTLELESNLDAHRENLLVKIGEFFIIIFIESKHRGVFEQAYNSFSQVCGAFWTSKNPRLSRLPTEWLQKSVSLCTGQKLSDKLCATRRSAGLPFLILALLNSEPTINKARFRNTFMTLYEVCENFDSTNREYRIHCLNVMRYIFRDSRLSELVAPYIANGVIIAIRSFTNEDWGIRNSATLLFSALVTRMFGVLRTTDSEEVGLKNRLTVKIFYMRFPELFNFLLEKLPIEAQNVNSTMLHPMLFILSRLYPSCIDELNEQMDEFTRPLEKCLKNPIYRTRDLAAKASVPLMNTSKILIRLEEIFNKLNSTVHNNETHGLLLQAFYIFRRSNIPSISLDEYISKSVTVLESAMSSNVGQKIYSDMNVTLYMEILVIVLHKYKDYDNVDMLKKVMTLLSKNISSKIGPLTSKSKHTQIRLILILYILTNKFEETDITYSTISNHIMCQIYDNNSEMRRYCLNLLISMHHIEHEYSRHPLFEVEELQIPEEIILLIETLGKSNIRKLLSNLHTNIRSFLEEQIKCQQCILSDDLLLLFLLVNYYPCVLKNLNINKQRTLNMLIDICNCDNEELISAVISCISTFLQQIDYNVVRYDQLLDILETSASPVASEYRRLAVSQFLIKNYMLYGRSENILNDEQLQRVLNIIMFLLEDDDSLIRKTMSNFAAIWKIRLTLSVKPKQIFTEKNWPIISEKAREDLLKLGTIVQKKDRAICFLFSWACRHFPDQFYESSEVFERGEVNLYAENIAFFGTCATLLNKLLWNLSEGLTYVDKSIFIEEQTLMVTTTLLDALLKYPSPMMSYKTKVTVICALKSIVKFLENFQINNNFNNSFKVYVRETIIEYLTKHIAQSDILNVKRIIQHIYQPAITYHS